MAARRKSPARSPRKPSGGNDETRAFAVILEDLGAKFTAFGEALQGLREHFDRRFEQVDARLDTLGTDVSLLKSASIEHGKQLREHGKKLDEHGKKLDEHGKKLDEHGKKLDEHGKKLDEHGKKLDEHGALLEKHGRLLEQHGEQLRQQSMQIGALRASVDRIEVKLEQKPDRDEVLALARSVLHEPSH